MPINPYDPPKGPPEPAEDGEPAWGFVRYFGLTLVEWVVVVSILFVLAGLFLPPVQSGPHPRRTLPAPADDHSD